MVNNEKLHIINVWNNNVNEEMRKISSLLKKYRYVSMDTEFPGIVYNLMSTVKTIESEYATLKFNVDQLRLIQVGLSLSDSNGNLPEGGGIWQFNLEFCESKDKYHPESIALLKKAGINFEKLESDGINHLLFADLLTSSGLLFNENIHWITFHGSYDFSYLMKEIMNQPLPPNSDMFFKITRIIFPNIYDIKTIISETDGFKNASLSKLASDLKVTRFGTNHQAGSDAYVTIECFFKLKHNYFIDGIPYNVANKIYGLNKDSIIAILGYSCNEIYIDNNNMNAYYQNYLNHMNNNFNYTTNHNNFGYFDNYGNFVNYSSDYNYNNMNQGNAYMQNYQKNTNTRYN